MHRVRAYTKALISRIRAFQRASRIVIIASGTDRPTYRAEVQRRRFASWQTTESSAPCPTIESVLLAVEKAVKDAQARAGITKTRQERRAAARKWARQLAR